ncbi:MAG: DUF547 domain-containing protein [Phycisphaerae bacterium]|nr:DUF547 domain-containing protein [Gemmatimonadaceae bacterium]
MRQYVGRVLLLATIAAAPSVGAQGKPARPTPLVPPSTVAGFGDADVVQPVPPSFDHSAFDALLHRHVRNGLIDYPAFRNNPEFARYLASLKTAKLDGLEEAERIAFWLNVYNAFTIQLVASHGETESIRNIDKTFGVLKLKGPWSRLFVEAAGRTLTLDDVQHRILRHDFSEPRVHFALSFATLGGPPQRSEAYTAAKLDEQLEDQARTFLRDTRKNRVDTANYTVHLSPVIARYRTDFGESTTSLGRFLADYFPDGGAERRFLLPAKRAPAPAVTVTAPVTGDSVARLQDSIRVAARNRRALEVYFRVKETPYDWGLNIQRRAVGKK